MTDTNGTFIVFEAGEGSGKTTQARILQEKLSGDTLLVREPGGTPAAEQIRSILLDRNLDVANRAELTLFCAARDDLVDKKVKPALQKGTIVIADRFDLSTIAYQIYGRENEEDIDYLRSFSDHVVGEIQPDAYIYLDIPAEAGLKRIRGRDGESTRIDQEKLSFHRRVRRGYKKTVEERDDCIEIDAGRSQEVVAEDVWRAAKGIM